MKCFLCKEEAKIIFITRKQGEIIESYFLCQNCLSSFIKVFLKEKKIKEITIKK